jgi:transcriptional adapter 3
LLEQTQINEARKSRLADIAQHRLAYHEYAASLDGIEKSIETAWAKRVKKYGAAPKKVPASTSLGNGTEDKEGRPPVPENVKKLVQVRRSWIDTVGKTMRERPRGEVTGIPEESVYEGVGEEVDERVVDEAMDLDLEEEV